MAERRIAISIVLMTILFGPATRRSTAQITLADDIILAAQGKENAARNRKSNLGRAPGSQTSPYRRRPGSSDVLLGVDPNRRASTLLNLTRRPSNPDELQTPSPGRANLGHGLAASIERLPPVVPSADQPGQSAALRDALDEDEGPPNGLTLDMAIERLVRSNPDLRSKYLEIPQAEADVVTAGLRENPLLFYSSDSIPYGSYSKQSPGEINHGLSFVLPVDYSGKREARITLAEREKCVLEAQYRNAVRLAIDELEMAYVDALAQRQAARSAQRGFALLDQLLSQARAKAPRGDAEEDVIDELTIERQLASMSTSDELARNAKAKQRLAVLLDLSPQESGALELRGSLRELGPKAPPVDTLIATALRMRPDLAAHRLGVARARAELIGERAERFSDAYLLYTPFQYRDNSAVGLNNTTSWGAGLFVSIPLFNRNQGNLKRARINVEQSRREIYTLEAQAVSEVRQALNDFQNTYEDAQQLEQTAIPAVRRKRDRAWRKLHEGNIGTDDFLSIQRDTTTLVRYYRDTLARHRRNALKINTAVGYRIFQ